MRILGDPLPFNFPLKNSLETKTLSSSGALLNGQLFLHEGCS